jgi:CheY-like chemotaxis protein
MPHSQASEHRMLANMKVLVVEDETIIAFGLEDMLGELGCEQVFLATQLSEADRILYEKQVDAAVLDVNIHGSQSYGIADKLADAAVPFIFATGYGDAEHPARHHGVPTLTKPYALGEVRTALSMALDAHS